MSDFVSRGRVVAAINVGRWLIKAWHIFICQPLMWIALVLVFFLIEIVVNKIPVIGSLATVALMPLFGAGMVAGCREIDEGGRLQLQHLFSGFRDRHAALTGMGVFYIGASGLAHLIAGLATDTLGLALADFFGYGALYDVSGTNPRIQAMAAIVIALLLPIVMTIWLVPPLLMFHNIGALEAFAVSASACLRNILSFLLYGAILLVLLIVAQISLLGWLLFIPIAAASLYAAYRDIYFVNGPSIETSA